MTRTECAIFAKDRNASTRTHTFPPEILALCFAPLPFSDLVHASHVSSHWRSVAVNAPWLWAVQELNSHRFSFEERVARSGCLPISVKCPTGNSCHELVPRSAFKSLAHSPVNVLSMSYSLSILCLCTVSLTVRLHFHLADI